MLAAIPCFESARLRLRPFTEADFEPMAAFFASPVSASYGGPCDRVDAWRKFAVYSGHWALRGYGPWALEDKASGVYVGLAGLWFPEGWIEPEITWALVPGQHGKGYATEAAQRALQAASRSGVRRERLWYTTSMPKPCAPRRAMPCPMRPMPMMPSRLPCTSAPANMS